MGDGRNRARARNHAERRAEPPEIRAAVARNGRRGGEAPGPERWAVAFESAGHTRLSAAGNLGFSAHDVRAGLGGEPRNPQSGAIYPGHLASMGWSGPPDLR